MPILQSGHKLDNSHEAHRNSKLKTSVKDNEKHQEFKLQTRSWMLSSERDRDKLATLLMVFATSKAKMEISLPSEAMPVKNPLFVCIFDTLFPKVFKKSTAFRAPPSAFVGATYTVRQNNNKQAPSFTSKPEG
ncbi:hypothetical protein SDJN02_17135, partial [Cucurbita argyrosperma subsp. argyrosperma]